MKTTTIFFILIFITCFSFAQDSLKIEDNFFFKTEFDSLGECYGKSLIQAEWDTIWKDEIIKPPLYKTNRIVKYIQDTTFFDFYFLMPGDENINLLLPFTDTSEIAITAIPKYQESKPIPAEYETVTEQYIISNAEKKWISHSGKIINSNNWYITELEVQYGTRTKTVIRTPGHHSINMYRPKKEKTMMLVKIVPKENILPYQMDNIKMLCKNYYPFKKEKISYEKRIIKGGIVRNKAFPYMKNNASIKINKIICNSKIPLIIQIQKQLYALGFYSGNFQGEFNNETKSAIIKYQVKNNLPIGQLDNETVEHILSRKTPFQD